jgi:hypothetical protein
MSFPKQFWPELKTRLLAVSESTPCMEQKTHVWKNNHIYKHRKPVITGIIANQPDTLQQNI